MVCPCLLPPILPDPTDRPKLDLIHHHSLRSIPVTSSQMLRRLLLLPPSPPPPPPPLQLFFSFCPRQSITSSAKI
uniref:Uncharacterized protein n=1 Tax=Caenorhabditis japonica TaxID=281687 RepID=A0A8R1IQ53_CAEJA